MDLQDTLFILVLAAACCLIWMYIQRRASARKRLNQIWREFAQLKGLNESHRKSGGEHEAMMKFQGQNQGLPFVMECIAIEGTPRRIGSVQLSTGDDIKIFTRMEISLPGLPRGLRVYRETGRSKLGKAVGMQDISIDDPEFDRAFMVKGKDEREVIDYLTPSRRMALLTQALDMKGLELEEQGLVLFRKGQIGSKDELETVFSQLSSIATSMTR
ncbi:MAG: hypothetical protein ACLQPD_23880 [Desulfomonilaceae bacterium]